MPTRMRSSIDSRKEDSRSDTSQLADPAWSAVSLFDTARPGSDTGGHPENSLFRQSASVDLTDDCPAAHDDHPVTDINQFLQIGRGNKDGAALAGETRPDALNLGARCDVDPTRRIDQDQDARIGGQPARHLHLLLIAA